MPNFAGARGCLATVSGKRGSAAFLGFVWSSFFRARRMLSTTHRLRFVQITSLLSRGSRVGTKFFVRPANLCELVTLNPQPCAPGTKVGCRNVCEKQFSEYLSSRFVHVLALICGQNRVLKLAKGIWAPAAVGGNSGCGHREAARRLIWRSAAPRILRHVETAL